MHIAALIRRFDLHGSSRQRLAQDVIVSLLQRGHDVTLLADSVPKSVSNETLQTLADHEQAKSIGKVQIIRKHPYYSHGSMGRISLQRFIRDTLDELKPDVALSFATTLAGDIMLLTGDAKDEVRSGLVPLRRLNKFRPDRIWDPVWLRRPFALSYEKRILSPSQSQFASPQSILVLNDHLQQDLVTRYPSLTDRLQRSSMGVKDPPMGKTDARRILHHSLSISKDSVVYLFADQAPELASTCCLLDALYHVVHHHQEKPCLLLAGVFGYETMELVAERGLRDYVRLIGRTTQMGDVYAAADVVLVSPRIDSGRRITLEAIRAGLPTISSDRDGYGHFIQQRTDTTAVSCGILIDRPDDPAVWGKAMADLSSSDRRASHSIACLAQSEQLGVATMMDQLEQALHAVVDG